MTYINCKKSINAKNLFINLITMAVTLQIKFYNKIMSEISY